MLDHFTKELDNLKSTLLQMASLVDDQVGTAIKAIETGDIELCRHLKPKDIEVDIFDNLIHTQCENLLALFQPFATDLRFIMSAMMVNNQLERCGDIAVNIGQRFKKAGGKNDIILEARILEMAVKSKEMLKNAIDSLFNNDIELAKKVLATDDEVDNYNKIVFSFLVDKMKKDPSSIDTCSHYIVLAKNIERLADHATNIAENIIFYQEARIISHEKKLSENKK